MKNAVKMRQQHQTRKNNENKLEKCKTNSIAAQIKQRPTDGIHTVEPYYWLRWDSEFGFGLWSADGSWEIDCERESLQKKNMFV